MSTGSNSIATRFQPGASGNPHGRPAGVRNKFSTAFVSDVAESWGRHGPRVLEQLATLEPARYADLCSRLIPRDVAVTVEQRLPGGLEADDWQLALAVFGAIKDALPDANQRQPAEVLSFVLDAIHAASAKTIGDCTE
jgi:hypothetical protein